MNEKVEKRRVVVVTTELDHTIELLHSGTLAENGFNVTDVAKTPEETDLLLDNLNGTEHIDVAIIDTNDPNSAIAKRFREKQKDIYICGLSPVMPRQEIPGVDITVYRNQGFNVVGQTLLQRINNNHNGNGNVKT